MADGRHIENRFLAILASYWPIKAKFGSEMKDHMRYMSRYQNCYFRKFKMADGRHFEKALSPYISRELSNFDQIWEADAHFNSHDGHVTKKSKFCKFVMTDGRHIENRFFWLYLGAILID